MRYNKDMSIHIQQKIPAIASFGREEGREGYANTLSLSMYFTQVEVKADELRCLLVYFKVSLLGTQIFIPI